MCSGIATYARSANSGLVVTGSALVAVHRHRIIALAARHKLPAVYPERSYVHDGGLLALEYSIDIGGGAPVLVEKIRPIGHEPAVTDV